MKFYTIGYGGRVPAEFASLLVLHGVRSVADVRIHPERASMGTYVKARSTDKGIEKLLGDCGIAYRSILELGNLFRDLEDWRPSYRALFDRAGDLLVERLGDLPATFLSDVRRKARGGVPPTGDRRFPGGHPRVERRAHRVTTRPRHRASPASINPARP